ncbi:membrane hypothetical protein [Vibrio chagasii]|nr:membrane hypothetical protein [Vibrio chagasii]
MNKELLKTLLSIFVSVIVFYFVQVNVESFFDYEGYQKYIEVENLALARFSNEIISAYLMHILSILDLNAKYLYFICNLSYFLAAFLFSRKFTSERNILFILMIANPISFVMYLTPRQTLSVSFVLLALLANSNHKKIVLFFISILCHTASGIIAMFFYRVYQGDLKKGVTYLTILVVVIFMVMNNIIPTKYAYVYTTEVSDDRGWGRILYFCVMAAFLFTIKNNVGTKLSIFTAISIMVIHTIAPIGGRVLYIAFPFLILSISTIKFNINKVVLLFVVGMNVTFCVSIIYLGLYGY